MTGELEGLPNGCPRCPICDSDDPSERRIVQSGPESWLCLDRFHGDPIHEAHAAGWKIQTEPLPTHPNRMKEEG